MDILTKPYLDTKLSDTTKLRMFDPHITNIEDYVWHRDREDRNITVIDGDGWMFQFDNELPFCINKGDEFCISKMVYHRIIPGSTPLRIVIDELVEEDTKLAVA